jgi:thiol-disulfide isomerase/thioredoxin
MHSDLKWLAVGIALAVGGGCSRSSGGAPPVAVAATSVNVQTLDYKGIENLIKSKHGKVVVIDVWSTSCPECVKTFPEFVALSKRIGPEKLACISLSLDYEGVGKPEDRLADVQKFLAERGATFDNVLASEEADVICKKLEVPAPPAVFVFDREGNSKQRFLRPERPGETVYQEVGSLVDELVK